MTQPKPRGYACPRCTVGRCLPENTVFAEVHQGQLLVVRNIQAYICDVCKLAEFEQEAMAALWHELYGERTAEDYQPLSPQKPSSSYSE